MLSIVTLAGKSLYSWNSAPIERMYWKGWVSPLHKPSFSCALHQTPAIWNVSIVSRGMWLALQFRMPRPERNCRDWLLVPVVVRRSGTAGSLACWSRWLLEGQCVFAYLSRVMLWDCFTPSKRSFWPVMTMRKNSTFFFEQPYVNQQLQLLALKHSGK